MLSRSASVKHFQPKEPPHTERFSSQRLTQRHTSLTPLAPRGCCRLTTESLMVTRAQKKPKKKLATSRHSPVSHPTRPAATAEPPLTTRRAPALRRRLSPARDAWHQRARYVASVWALQAMQVPPGTEFTSKGIVYTLNPLRRVVYVPRTAPGKERACSRAPCIICFICSIRLRARGAPAPWRLRIGARYSAASAVLFRRAGD